MTFLIATLLSWFDAYNPLILSAAAFIAAVIVFYKKIKQAFIVFGNVGRSIYRFFTAPALVLKMNEQQNETLSKQNQILAEIRAQVFPNGGQSMSDRLDKVLNFAKMGERRSLILSEHSNIPTFECDEFGLCVWVNTALANLFGMERAEMLGNGWLKAVDSDDKQRVWRTFKESIEQNIPYSSNYTVVSQRTGQRIYCYASAEVTRTPQNKVIFIHGTVVPTEYQPKSVDASGK